MWGGEKGETGRERGYFRKQKKNQEGKGIRTGCCVLGSALKFQK